MVVNVQSYLRVLDRPLPVRPAVARQCAGRAAARHGSCCSRGERDRGDLPRAVWPSATSPPPCAASRMVVRGVEHHRGDTRRALRMGLPTVPHQVAIFLASGILVLVAGWLFGSAEAGRLQLAVLIGSAPGVLTSSLNNAWAPIVYRTPEHDRAEVLEHTGRDIAAADRPGGGVRRSRRAGAPADRGAGLLRPRRDDPAVGPRRGRHGAVGALPLQRPPGLRLRAQRGPRPRHAGVPGAGHGRARGSRATSSASPPWASA